MSSISRSFVGERACVISRAEGLNQALPIAWTGRLKVRVWSLEALESSSLLNPKPFDPNALTLPSTKSAKNTGE